MQSVVSSVKDDTSSQFTSGLQETNEALMESAISSIKGDTSLFLDSKRSFDGVGHQQCQGRHVVAVYF